MGQTQARPPQAMLSVLSAKPRTPTPASRSPRPPSQQPCGALSSDRATSLQLHLLASDPQSHYSAGCREGGRKSEFTAVFSSFLVIATPSFTVKALTSPAAKSHIRLIGNCLLNHLHMNSFPAALFIYISLFTSRKIAFHRTPVWDSLGWKRKYKLFSLDFKVLRGKVFGANLTSVFQLLL